MSPSDDAHPRAADEAATPAPPDPKTATEAKKKKPVSSNYRECANCLSSRLLDGSDGPLHSCARCGLVYYCGRPCQVEHWKFGKHKQFCVTREERSVAAQDADCTAHGNGESACAICLDPLETLPVVTLPCEHRFHSACVDGMREFGIQQACPSCRSSLPQRDRVDGNTLSELVESANRRYWALKKKIESRDGGWGALSTAHQRGMDDVVARLVEAADQGHAQAQFRLGWMHSKGESVQQGDEEAVRWYRKAADQGHAAAQCNLGLMYKNGQGVKQSHKEAFRW